MAFTVEFEEVEGYPRSRWTRGIFLGTRRLRCAWADRVSLLTELDLDANLPWPYPDGPDDALLFQMSLDPLGKQTGAAGLIAAYDHAIVTCWYANDGPRLYGTMGAVTEQIVGGGQTAKLPSAGLHWATPTGVIVEPNEAPALTVYEFVYQVTFHRQKAVPSWVRLRTRRVNPVPYSTFLLGYVFPAQTMLYQPAYITVTASVGRLTTYEVTVRYRIHPSWADVQQYVGWNTWWRVETASYEPIYQLDGNRYIQYPTW